MQRGGWELPGPSRFVSRIVADLRLGKSVVLLLPDSSAPYAPAGLAGAVRSVLGERGEDWYRLTVNGGEHAPLDLLCAHFARNLLPEMVRTIGILAEQPSFARKIVWIEDIGPCNWPAWRTFLGDYQHTSQEIDALQRTVLCVPLLGDVALMPPREDARLAVHRWEAAVEVLDVQVFVAELMQNRQLPELHKRVASAIIANLALWDLALAERLARQEIAVVLDPVALLRRIAEERGWHEPARMSPSWNQGMVGSIDGRDCLHSALLAGNDPFGELARRIWSAEVTVLLPFVESMRRELVGRLGVHLRVPFITEYGIVIEDRQNLEIGHIDFQLRRVSKKVDARTRRLVRQLTEIRNELCHVKTIGPRLLQFDAIV